MERLHTSALCTDPYTIDCGLRIHGARFAKLMRGPEHFADILHS